MDSWVLVPCQFSRLAMLKNLLVSLDHPTEKVVVVTTIPEVIRKDDLIGYSEHVLIIDSPSIACWWNAGLDYIKTRTQKFHEVLAISSDYTGTNYSVAMLGAFMRQHGLTMSGPNPHTDQPKFFTLATPRNPLDRVPGACWMLAGESGLRADEQFRWWYSDDDLDMQARQAGGSGSIPGTGLVGGPDTPLSEQKFQWAAEDRQKFISKWGLEPW